MLFSFALWEKAANSSVKQQLPEVTTWHCVHKIITDPFTELTHTVTKSDSINSDLYTSFGLSVIVGLHHKSFY